MKLENNAYRNTIFDRFYENRNISHRGWVSLCTVVLSLFAPNFNKLQTNIVLAIALRILVFSFHYECSNIIFDISLLIAALLQRKENEFICVASIERAAAYTSPAIRGLVGSLFPMQMLLLWRWGLIYRGSVLQYRPGGHSPLSVRNLSIPAERKKNNPASISLVV